MAWFRFTLGIGFAGARHDTEYEIDDEELAGLDADARDKAVQEHWTEWAWNYIDGGPEEIAAPAPEDAQ